MTPLDHERMSTLRSKNAHSFTKCCKKERKRCWRSDAGMCCLHLAVTDVSNGPSSSSNTFPCQQRIASLT